MKRINDGKIIDRFLNDSDYKEQFSFDASKDTELFLAAPGEYIIKEGVRPEYLFYLCSGKAKLYMTLPDRRVNLIDFFSAPCFIGEMELISEDNDVRAVQALESCYCLGLPLRRYRKLLLEDPRFLRSLCLLLGRKNYRNTRMFIRNQSYPLLNRLSAFILLTESDGLYRERHTQTSEYLGVSYRHLLYVMAELVERGYLKKERRAYRINDRAGLEGLAEVIEDI